MTKHRNVTLTETQERAFNAAAEAHDKKVHFAWFPKNAEWENGYTRAEFDEDMGRVAVGEWLLQSWSGSRTDKGLPIWERIANPHHEEFQWREVGYYSPDTGNLVLK